MNSEADKMIALAHEMFGKSYIKLTDDEASQVLDKLELDDQTTHEIEIRKE